MKNKKEKGQPHMGMAGIIIDGVGGMGGVATVIVVGLSWLTSSLVLVTIFKIISFKKKKKKTEKKKQKHQPWLAHWGHRRSLRHHSIVRYYF